MKLHRVAERIEQSLFIHPFDRYSPVFMPPQQSRIVARTPSHGVAAQNLPGVSTPGYRQQRKESTELAAIWFRCNGELCRRLRGLSIVWRKTGGNATGSSYVGPPVLLLGLSSV